MKTSNYLIFFLIMIFIISCQKEKTPVYSHQPINYDSLEKANSIISENRRKERYAIEDKYESIIKRYKRNPLKTINILEDDGFTLSETVQVSPSTVLYGYTKYENGFKIKIAYNDSDNPRANEVLLINVEDTKSY